MGWKIKTIKFLMRLGSWSRQAVQLKETLDAVEEVVKDARGEAEKVIRGGGTVEAKNDALMGLVLSTTTQVEAAVTTVRGILHRAKRKSGG